MAMEKIKNSCENQLKSLLLLENPEPNQLLIKTLAAGVVLNLCNGNISTLPVELINQIIAILANTLDIDHRLTCNQLSSNVPLSDKSGSVPSPKGKEAQILENHIKSVLQTLDAQQSAIEIIANICSCEGMLLFFNFNCSLFATLCNTEFTFSN